MKEKQSSFLITLYVSVAFLLSLCLLQFQYFMTPDGVYFTRFASLLSRGESITMIPGHAFVNHLPGYPFAIAIVNILCNNLELAAHLVSSLSFALTLIPIYFLAKSIYDKQTAFLSMLLFATHGFVLIHSYLTLGEPLFTFIFSIFLYYASRLLHAYPLSWKNAVGLGVLGCSMYLTRSEGLLFFTSCLFGILLFNKSKLINKIIFFTATIMLFSCSMIPYMSFVHKNTGSWHIHEQANGNLWQRQQDVSGTIDYIELKKVMQGLSDDNQRLRLKDIAKKATILDIFQKDDYALIRSIPFSASIRIKELGKYLFCGLGYFLILLAFFRKKKSINEKRIHTLLIITFLPFTINFITVFEPKRFLILFPILSIWMASGALGLISWMTERISILANTKKILLANFILLAIIFSSLYLHHALKGSPLPTEYKSIGLWAQNNISDIKNEKIAARSPYASFYSGSKILQLPYVEDFNNLFQYMKFHQSKYLIIGSDLDTPMNKAYSKLLIGDAFKQYPLKKLHEIEEHIHVRLFELDLGQIS